MAEQIVEAPMKARVIRFHLQKGSPVKVNDRVCEIEAMKMEIPVLSPAAGTIKEVYVSPGQAVEGGTPLFAVES